MRQMYATVCIDLPADEFDEAEAKVKIRPLWEALIAGLQAADLRHNAKLETLSVKAKRADAGKPRARKQAADRPPRLVPPPQDAA